MKKAKNDRGGIKCQWWLLRTKKILSCNQINEKVMYIDRPAFSLSHSLIDCYNHSLLIRKKPRLNTIRIKTHIIKNHNSYTMDK